MNCICADRDHEDYETGYLCHRLGECLYCALLSERAEEESSDE